jgi:hypothetical protein
VTTRTWIGGRDNSVYDANDWSPAGVPQPGDALYMLDGTADMEGGDLSGDILHMGYTEQFGQPTPAVINPVLNISNGANLNVFASSLGPPNSSTINVMGHVGLNVLASTSTHFGSTDLQINLNHGVLDASLQIFNETVTVAGPGKFHNINTDFDIGTLNITADIIGTGTTSLRFAHEELGGSVSSQQTFSFGAASSLTIDQPHQFHGLINGPTDNAAPGDQVNLLGIQADSYSLANDLLTLYSDDKVVDRLRLHDTSGSTSVGQGPSGVVIGMNLALPSDVSPLPTHSS